jgi:predicted metal-dependent hydrolase
MIDPQPLELEHKNRHISYRWRKSTRATRYRVTVGPDGVEVITPSGASQRDAERFLRLHADWVLAQQERVQKLESRRRPPGAAMAKLAPGLILIQGREFKLEIREEAGRKTRAAVEESGWIIRVKVPIGEKNAAEVVLTAFLKKKADVMIQDRVKSLSTSFGKKPTRISVRSQKSRWGSCSSRGTLSFNWRLVMVPPEILDYVILHELVHFEEPNHSPRFWQKLAAWDPECHQHRRWLRENQSYLYDPLIR